MKLSYFIVPAENSSAVDMSVVIQNACFMKTKERLWKRQDMLDLLTIPYVELWVFHHQNIPCGYVIFKDIGGELDIISVGVSPEYQGQSIGAVIIQCLIKDKQPQHVFLEVRRSNEPAKALYRKLGFAQAGIRRQYYTLTDGQKEDALVMHLNCSVLKCL